MGVFLSMASAQGGKKPYLLIDAIDTSVAKCTYQYTITEGTKMAHTAVLQIGRKTTKFASSRTYYMDSLGLVLGNKPYTPAEILRYHNELPASSPEPAWTLYDGYPRGQVSIVESISGLHHFLSREERTLPSWHIERDSVKVLMGHECTLAHTELHGRKWHVWFAPTIPLPSGPWLLRGLPGLVVHAYDTEREHEFVLLDIARSGAPIGFRRNDFFEESRENVIREKRKYLEDRAGYMRQATAGQIAPSKSRPKPYNPLRRLPH